MGLHCQFHKKKALILGFMEILTDLPLYKRWCGIMKRTDLKFVNLVFTLHQ